MSKEKEKIEKDDNYWKGYIQKQKEAEEICKMCNYRNKYKEAREILDKVTYKLKELDFRLYLQKEEDKIAGKDINTIINVRLDLEEILNIIEGEKNNANRRKRRR